MWPLLQEKFEADFRPVEGEFQLPLLSSTFEYASPILLFWIQIGIYLTIQSFINLMMGLIIWFYVVQRRETSTALLVALGGVIPFSLFLPFKLIPLLDIRNTTLLITLGAQAPLIVFRCLQALFNTSPPYAETSLRYFLLYHTSPVGFVFDTNTNAIRQFSRRELLGKVRNLLTSIISVTFLMNLLLSTNFAPFPSREISNLTDYFYWGNLANRYLMAYLLGTYLESGTIAAAIAISLISGFSTVDFNDSPLTKSTSVAEFWGYRWNKVVGGYLKFAVFKPVLKSGWNKVLAVIATFFASGLLHEYVLLCCTLKGGQGFPVQPKYFRQTGFFLWNGMMLILEQYLTSAKGARQIASKLPGAFRTALVVMTSLPISHWFIDEFTAAGVLNDFSVAFPRIRKIS